MREKKQQSPVWEIFSVCVRRPPSPRSSTGQDREDERQGGKAWKGTGIKPSKSSSFSFTSYWNSSEPVNHVESMLLMSLFVLRWSPEVKTHPISSLPWWRTWPVKTLRFVMNPLLFRSSSQCSFMCRWKKLIFLLFWKFVHVLMCDLIRIFKKPLRVWLYLRLNKITIFPSSFYGFHNFVLSLYFTFISVKIIELICIIWIKSWFIFLWPSWLSLCSVLQVKKLVYVYLVRYAEEQQDLALLSISTFQRGLKVQLGNILGFVGIHPVLILFKLDADRLCIKKRKKVSRGKVTLKAKISDNTNKKNNRKDTVLYNRLNISNKPEAETQNVKHTWRWESSGTTQRGATQEKQTHWKQTKTDLSNQT